ncbi:hypothetical protein ACFXP1_02010 [Streptomyces sp. NPDC059112]
MARSSSGSANWRSLSAESSARRLQRMVEYRSMGVRRTLDQL